MITRDHRRMEELFARLRLEPDKRPQLLDELEAVFVAHSRAEEDKVYPVIAEEGDPDKGMKTSAVEHHAAEKLLERLKKAHPQSKEFGKRLQAFVTAVTHHVQEEELEVLPALKKAVDDTRLRELGRAFDEQRTQEMRKFGGTSTGQVPRQRLYDEAKELGIDNYSGMDMQELVDAINRARRD
nr:hemerythrin domain-containing protein [Nocardiopsis algeriensis]